MKSYSHPETRQDLWVMEKLGAGAYKFLELGAYDGITHSNTLLLEENGWLGILVEGHGEYAWKCRENRVRARVFNDVIGDGGVDEMVVGGQYTGLVSSMPSSFMAEHLRRGNMFYSVQTVPLANITLGPVDYFSLDTEGNEYIILRDWLAAGGRCRLLTVEYRYSELMQRRLTHLCQSYGLFLDQIRGFDLCFCTEDLL